MAPGNPPSRDPRNNPRSGGTSPQRRSVMGGAQGSGGAGTGARAGQGTARPTSRAAAGGAAGGNGGGTRRTAAVGGGTGGRGGGTRTASGRRRLIDYPRQGKTGIRRWLPSWRQILGVLLTGLLLVVGAFIVLYATTGIPEPDDFVDAQTTTVYYSDGATVMGTFGKQNRVLVDGETIPPHVRDAVVAGEDRSFYENPGINPAGLARALWNNLRGGEKQGGSSITQQYAERYYIGKTVTDYRGKLNEALLAIKLDRAQDKDEILANYLNTIYFGRDAYGIETAARSYFGVGVAELTVSQAALLAGVIPSPNNFDPRISVEQAERRWNYVLDGMVVTGTLTQAERDAQVFPETIEYVRSDTLGGTQGYLLDMARTEILAQSPITEDELSTVGYKIVTTIDKPLQDLAVAAVDSLPDDHAPNLRTALVTLNPVDGSIVTLYGGPDFVTQSRNAVTQDVAQAGSTFKPFTLAAYLENGGSLKSRYVGTNRFPVEGFPEGVRNYGGQNFGKIDLVQATAQSVNAVYAQMNVEVGPAATLDAARRAGLPDDALVNQEVPANVLGTASPHPLDMAQAFNTFAAQGMRTDPFIVRTVEYLKGGLAYQGGQNPERVFEADVMADVTYAMTQVVEDRSGTARDAQQVGHPVAGKTGTSNDNRSAWFIGYTAHLTTAVALYQVGPNGETEEITPFGGVSQVTGGSLPLDVWTAFMTPAMAGRTVIQFPERADVGEPNTPPIIGIPDVTGMAEADALAALGGAGFSAVVQRGNDPAAPAGTVFSQNPTGEAEQGSEVTIIVSDGPGTMAVPTVTGMTQGAARSALEGAGFAVTVSQTKHATVPEGNVISSSPGAGEQAPPGSTVTIVVSTGPPEEEEEPPVEDPELPIDPDLGNDTQS